MVILLPDNEFCSTVNGKACAAPSACVPKIIRQPERKAQWATYRRKNESNISQMKIMTTEKNAQYGNTSRINSEMWLHSSAVDGERCGGKRLNGAVFQVIFKSAYHTFRTKT